MARIYPFRAYRPAPGQASQVASVPYDVVNRQEARTLAQGNPNSFLHVTKPEIDLPDTVSSYDDSVYQQGRTALQRLIADNVLVQDETPCLYAYALTMHGRTQTGIVCSASVADYDTNTIKKHEYTRPQKEDDRVKNIEALSAQSGTVFLAHRQHPDLQSTIAAVTANAPEVDFVSEDAIQHQLWVIADDAQIKTVVGAFDSLGPIYIADGHHRSAAASRVAADHRAAAGDDHPESQSFLAVSFPEDELLIMGYHRVVQDLMGRSPSEFLAAVGEVMDISLGKEEPTPKCFNMFLDGVWYTLTARSDSYAADDPVESLDVSILQSQVLEPLLGITDPRRDTRIDFVGGIRGDDALTARVSDGWAVAFKLHPTAIGELLAIADAEEVMPPKSTWFEPKLRDGLFVHAIEEM